MRKVHPLLGWCALAFSVAATAGETIVYRYDELGRLKRVDRSGSVNNGLGAEYAYDPADNRAYVGVGGANPASPANVAGGGFEAPVTATYVYRPTASFAGGSGLAANNSAWHFAGAPEGNQVAFLQTGAARRVHLASGQRNVAGQGLCGELLPQRPARLSRQSGDGRTERPSDRHVRPADRTPSRRRPPPPSPRPRAARP